MRREVKQVTIGFICIEIKHKVKNYYKVRLDHITLFTFTTMLYGTNSNPQIFPTFTMNVRIIP